MTDKLFVLWAPQKRRHVVGTLSREPGMFTFRYADNLGITEASGFEELTGFSRSKREFRSPHLFAAFSHRVPSPRRPDFEELIDEWGVENPDDAFEILARSGGLQVMDSVELAEYRAPEDRLETPLLFRVAGPSYGDDPNGRAVSPGDRVVLRREPSNTFDPSAVLVESSNGARLGYVPRQYADLVSGLLADGELLVAEATRKLLVPGEGRRWVIRAWHEPRSFEF